MSDYRPNGHSNDHQAKPHAIHRGSETAQDRFLRIAPGRVQRALDAIALIGHLAANKYEYSEDEAHQITNALMLAVEDVSRKLHHVKPDKQRFSFK